MILGLASSGVHSNGFSLVRRVVEASGVALRRCRALRPGQTLGEALLTPTRIYVRSCLAAVRSGKVKALAHITGGGLVENVPRVLPENLAAEFDARRWPLPPVFGWMMRAGGIADAEMARVFNCGLGMVAVVAPGDAAEVQAILEAGGETVFQAGKVVPRAAGAAGSVVRETATAWPG